MHTHLKKSHSLTKSQQRRDIAAFAAQTGKYIFCNIVSAGIFLRYDVPLLMILEHKDNT